MFAIFPVGVAKTHAEVREAATVFIDDLENANQFRDWLTNWLGTKHDAFPTLPPVGCTLTHRGNGHYHKQDDSPRGVHRLMTEYFEQFPDMAD